jgi:2-oxoglutarate dehydrogenase complex dehydrogenase (E1) component-like enzyme
MGAWDYVRPRLTTTLLHGGWKAPHQVEVGEEVQRPLVGYVGRPAAASPATASFRIHQSETQEIIEAALSVS